MVEFNAGPRLSHSDVQRFAHKYSARVLRIYDHVLNGFAAGMTASNAAEMAKDARVKLVEQDTYVRPSSVQSAPNFALDRIDQRTGLDGTYSCIKTGDGVRVYIVDSGISYTDEFLYSPVVNSFTLSTIDGTPDYTYGYCYERHVRCHGTRVADIVGGHNYGVAKSATLVNVKVWDWQLSSAEVARDYTCPADAPPAVFPYGGPGPSCDASPGRPGSLTYSSTLVNPHNRTTIAVSATHYFDSAVNQSITQYYCPEGTDLTSYWAANQGECVDIFAPGHGVAAIAPPEFHPTDMFYGTSAASPCVAGVVALYLEGKGSNYDPNAVEEALKRNATANVLSNVQSGTANLLVYSRVDLWH